jgi:hypothetical protein
MSKEKINIKGSTAREVQMSKEQILAYNYRPVIRGLERPRKLVEV